MSIWPPKNEYLRRPVYRSLADLIVRAIEAGELRAGDRLPTHRNLAFDLGLSVQTVSRAYEELIRSGFVSGEVGRGTFVNAIRSGAKTPFTPDSHYGSIIECSILKPVIEPFHLDLMRKSLARIAEDLPASVMSSFRPAGVLKSYDRSSRRWLQKCGLNLSNQSVLLTNGATSAMTIALMTAASTGDTIVAEVLSHHTLMPLCRYLGLRLQGLEMDEFGMLPSALAAACQQSPVRVLYLMPSGLNPCAVIMSPERREELVEIARFHNVLIIENDAWGPLQADRTPPIAAMAPERTFYFTSLTKCLLPGLRTGWLVAPETFGPAVANRHMVTNWMASPLTAEIAARWIEDTTATTLLLWQRKTLVERNRLARDILGGLDFNAADTGMHVWLPMPGGWSEDGFVAHARINGVAVGPGSAFRIREAKSNPGVRICLGAETAYALTEGLKIIARLARSQPEPAMPSL